MEREREIILLVLIKIITILTKMMIFTFRKSVLLLERYRLWAYGKTSGHLKHQQTHSVYNPTISPALRHTSSPFRYFPPCKKSKWNYMKSFKCGKRTIIQLIIIINAVQKSHCCTPWKIPILKRSFDKFTLCILKIFVKTNLMPFKNNGVENSENLDFPKFY